MLVEHARNVLGVQDASHAEYGATGTPVVTPLACSLVDSQIEIAITPGSRLAELYGEPAGIERTHCNYGLAPGFDHIASMGGLSVSARDAIGEVRAVERRDHSLFVATLYQPQRSSRPGSPHPIWVALLRAVTGQHGADRATRRGM